MVFEKFIKRLASKAKNIITDETTIYAEISVLKMKEKHQEALELLEHSSAKNNTARYFYNKAGMLYDLKRDQEALECYDKATELDPHYLKAWYWKGDIYFKRATSSKEMNTRAELCEKAAVCFETVTGLCSNKSIRKTRLDADSWYITGLFMSFLSWAQVNNSLVLAKTPSRETEAHFLANVFMLYPIFRNKLSFSNDKHNEFVIYNEGPLEVEKLDKKEIGKFLDFCNENAGKILEKFRPKIFAEIWSQGSDERHRIVRLEKKTVK